MRGVAKAMIRFRLFFLEGGASPFFLLGMWFILGFGDYANFCCLGLVLGNGDGVGSAGRDGWDIWIGWSFFLA